MKNYNLCSYLFEELSEEAKQRAIETMDGITTDNGWWDNVYCDTKTISELMGIKIENIYFSGFYSQGEGAQFTGEYSYKKGSVKAIKEYAPLDETLHNIAEKLQAVQKKAFYKLYTVVKSDGRYSHEYDTRITTYTDFTERETSQYYDEVAEVLRDFMRWIYKQLKEEYEYLTSEAAIIEAIESNGYEFLKDGELFNCSLSA